MKNKFSKLGFTLIELLAVIIVMIIIIAIAIPLVLNFKEIVKREAFRATAHSIADAGRLLVANENESQGYQEFYYLDGKEYNADGWKLDYNGKGPETGVVVINETNKVAMAIHNGTYCAIKSTDTNTVTVTKTLPEECNAYSVIQTCDSWEQIALRYDLTLEELLAFNDETDPNSSTCDRDIKIPVKSDHAGGSYARGDETSVYYKTYYTVGYVSTSVALPFSYEYTIQLGVLPLPLEDIEVTRVTMKSVFESLNDFKRYIVKKNMGEVIWPGGDTTPLDISQTSVFRDHAARNANMTSDDVSVMCDTEACYATVNATTNNFTNVNPNTIEGVGQVVYTPIKFTVEFNGQGESCAVRTTGDAEPGILTGAGTSTDPYLIESIEDIVALSNNVAAGNTYSGKHLSQTISFDFKNKRSYADPNTTAFGDINGNGIIEGLLTELTTGSGFKPIGSNTATFNGRWLGNLECIYNLYINRPTTDYVGLFGYINADAAVVKNLTLTNPKIIGYNYTGVIAGMINRGKIENSNLISVNVSGNIHTGGIAGYNDSSINNCTVSGDVTGVDNVGLIVGYNYGSVSSVVADGNTTGVNNVGGLLGTNHYWSTIRGILKSGSVVGTGSNVNRCIGDIDYSDNVGMAALNNITVNGSTIICLSGEVQVPCTNPASKNGLDITTSDLLSEITYTDRGFNFSDEALDYIWSIDGGAAKFREGSL